MTNEVLVGQLLFGYQEGHRLLGASFRPSSDSMSVLLPLSDLIPGLKLEGDQGYLTGIPLATEELFVLMKTWTAPEISRQGCVWTHALAISFADLARISDLSVFSSKFVRPEGPGKYDKYSNILRIPVGSTSSISEVSVLGYQDMDRIATVFGSIYLQRQVPVEKDSDIEELNSAIVAIWSQQWPGLRRAFSFQVGMRGSKYWSTVPSIPRVSKHSTDVQPPLRAEESSTEPWELACIEDIVAGKNTALRKFLWRYGTDLRPVPSSLRFLAELYVESQGPNSRLWSEGLLDRVARVLPRGLEGRVLKEDLTTGNIYSLLPRVEPIQVLSYFLTNPKQTVFEYDPQTLVGRVSFDSEEGVTALIPAVEIAVRSDNDISDLLIRRFAMSVSLGTLFGSESTTQELRSRILEANPIIIDNDDIRTLSVDEVVECLPHVSRLETDIRDRVLGLLFMIDSHELAATAFAQFPHDVIRILVRHLASRKRQNSVVVAKNWVDVVRANPQFVFSGNHISKAPSTSVLAVLARLIGYLQQQTLDVGCTPWAEALANATDDIEGVTKDEFATFLFQLGLRRTMSGCETLFEYSFEYLHRRLWYSNLDLAASSRLVEVLPDLGFLRNWDFCLRLSYAVVGAYIEYGLKTEGFRKLAADRNLRETLGEIASSKKMGRRLF